ncbi:hypothetical protein SAMN05192534_10959 [Alteribacillus persepolensis]|uniref:Uncharacterized protein n=1 Tax=Alteribacillus persepolensis TaxID=568899 RepID=A0A1G8EED6_9BACI|nr:hypothetical protein [Alteribacillus persepolensis]SDH68248.1 hypothetical protein SAMN05192534_10959 [Alteribacillus persepolensis]
MEEEFMNQKGQSDSREEEHFPMTPDYYPGTQQTPFYSPAPSFAFYPVHVQPDYRGYSPAYHFYAQQPHAGTYPNYPAEQQGERSAAEQRNMPELCRRYQYHLVQMEGTDGQIYDGIIEDVDNDNVYLLEPAGDDNDMDRQPPYGFGFGYGGYPPYGYGYPRRFRRFRRRRYPYFFFRRLFFPFFY